LALQWVSLSALLSVSQLGWLLGWQKVLLLETQTELPWVLQKVQPKGLQSATWSELHWALQRERPTELLRVLQRVRPMALR